MTLLKQARTAFASLCTAVGVDEAGMNEALEKVDTHKVQTAGRRLAGHLRQEAPELIRNRTLVSGCLDLTRSRSIWLSADMRFTTIPLSN